MVIKKSPPLEGEAKVNGSKNAALAIMASLLLTSGRSIIKNVPNSADIRHMIMLLQGLGCEISFAVEQNELMVDTTHASSWCVDTTVMKKMRASLLVMGPLLARFGRVQLSLPGGCAIGSRPINYHLNNLKKMGANFIFEGDIVLGHATALKPQRLVLEYPSVGTTENCIMASALTDGTTTIINASVEPEVIDLISAVKKMGVAIEVLPANTIVITGKKKLDPIIHTIIPDRLEAGALLLAGAITSGKLYIPDFSEHFLDVFLLKLKEMGHAITVGLNGKGIMLTSTRYPKAVSFKTAPFPGFPTDLQAPMMALQTVAQGTALIEEAVFENRMSHADELQKMGAFVEVTKNTAFITGVSSLQGAVVSATDIRASCSLLLAGLVAEGTTTMYGLDHWQRGYDSLEAKLVQLGASLTIIDECAQQQMIDTTKKNQPTSIL